ncbi:unnamed protein product [Rhizoctonia solani]|uniref:Uncharacterized protein n=1 Tax=Rhizoctonia solani TaxID=456999 RepID=A0A8H2XZV9_9AGAM|nr:unnamed protein product [Rhizoctonia solani]
MEPIPFAQYNSSLHVFGILELAKLICNLIPRSDNARLLCVCRQLSQDIRPFVWEHTDAVETLIGMIPETRVDTYIDEPFRPYLTMHLPKSLDISRLGIYAPHIKSLDIPLTTSIDEYKNWGGFLSSIGTQAIELLPNLEHLRLALPRDTRGETIRLEAFNWAVAFMSSSLLSFRVYPELRWDADIKEFSDAWIKLELATHLLRNLSKRCPKLNSLMILPGNIELKTKVAEIHPRLGQITEVVPTLAKFWAPLEKIHLILPRFQSLRILSATPYILEPAAFIALSKLPCLESLTMRDVQLDNDWQGYCYKLDSELTDQSFPALQHLELIDLLHDTLIHICNQRPLAQALHSLRPAIAWSNVHQNKLAHLLGLLAKHRSPVGRLCLFHIPPNWSLFPYSINLIFHLKLTHLSIPQPNGFNYEMAQLAHVAPALESLEFNQWMCDRDFRLEELWPIATLWPNLRHLSAPIEFSSAGHLGEPGPAPRDSQSLEPFCLESYFYDDPEVEGVPIPIGQTPLAKYTDKIARYIYALWPTVECKAKQLPSYFEDRPDLIRLNDLISRLRSQPPGL